MAEYYFITDENYTNKGVIHDIKVALDCGVKLIQYRVKGQSTRKMVEQCQKIKPLCENYGARLIINDRVDLAKVVDSHGVHLGQGDMHPSLATEIFSTNRFYGVSISSKDDMQTTDYDFVNYFGVGPIFKTSTKKNATEPIGLEFLKELTGMTNKEIAAIGGINLSNIDKVKNAGTDYICAISAAYLYDESDLSKGINRIINALKD